MNTNARDIAHSGSSNYEPFVRFGHSSKSNMVSKSFISLALAMSCHSAMCATPVPVITPPASGTSQVYPSYGSNLGICEWGFE
jgi:hypothetical protein